MCLAIWKPKGVSIEHSHLKNGFANNSDGAGVAWSDGRNLHHAKGIFNPDELVEAYEKHRKCPMLIHFRFATHGKVSTENCHPFVFGDGRYAAIHNGILPIKTEPGESDTATFVRLVLEPMSKRLAVSDPVLMYLVQQTIGANNKIAVMDNKGTPTIFNEKSGHWHKGAWYSNTDYAYVVKWSRKWLTSTEPESRGVLMYGEDYAEDSVVIDYDFDGMPLCQHCTADLTDVLHMLDQECPYCGEPLPMVGNKKRGMECLR